MTPNLERRGGTCRVGEERHWKKGKKLTDPSVPREAIGKQVMTREFRKTLLD